MINRRQLIRGGIGAAAFVGVAGFGPPACDKVSKDKAVRYTGITINYLEDMLPVLAQIGGQTVAELLGKAISLLEKLKKALEDSDFDDAGNFFDNVINVLGQVATALLQLPESGKRTVVIGILTAAQITLRTVSLFIESETPNAVTGPRRATMKRTATPEAIMKAFEATRFP